MTFSAPAEIRQGPASDLPLSSALGLSSGTICLDWSNGSAYFLINANGDTTSRTLSAIGANVKALTATNNAVSTVSSIGSRLTAGFGANNIGSRIAITAPDTTGVDQALAGLVAQATNATNGAITSLFQVEVRGANAVVVAAQVDEPTVNDDVGLLVRRRTAGVNSLTRVTLGAVDSGGVGFRLLRTTNA